MKDIDWRIIDRRELAGLIDASPQVSAQAVGDATVYRLEADGRETLAVALADGQAVLLERKAPSSRRRRRVDGGRPPNPASR